MQVTVTREDIEQSAKLLEMLQKWEKLTKISHEYNQGQVVLSMNQDANSSIVEKVLVDRYYHRSPALNQTAVSEAERSICLLVGQRIEQLAKEACDIIRYAMPFPIQDQK